MPDAPLNPDPELHGEDPGDMPGDIDEITLTVRREQAEAAATELGWAADRGYGDPLGQFVGALNGALAREATA